MEAEQLIYLLKREAIDHGKADYKHLVAAELERLHDKVQELEETHEIQLASISIAACGHWNPDMDVRQEYDTEALRDVAELYAKKTELEAMLLAAWRRRREILENE